MVENHVSPTSGSQEEGNNGLKSCQSNIQMAGGREKWLKIMSVQHLYGIMKEKMVENHVSPTSG